MGRRYNVTSLRTPLRHSEILSIWYQLYFVSHRCTYVSTSYTCEDSALNVTTTKINNHAQGTNSPSPWHLPTDKRPPSVTSIGSNLMKAPWINTQQRWRRAISGNPRSLTSRLSQSLVPPLSRWVGVPKVFRQS